MKKLTMASPFTLVPDGGYPIFLFLLFPIALSYSQLHLVQKAIDISNRIAPSVTIATTTTSARRVWDPGISKTRCPAITLLFGQAPPASTPWLTNSSVLMSPQLVSASTHAFVAPTVDRSNPHNLADKCRGALIQSLFQYSHPILSRPTVPNIR